ncbi:hypothetical protein ACWDRR_22105 [Kitasatospora sp. NPDC003701]
MSIVEMAYHLGVPRATLAQALRRERAALLRADSELEEMSSTVDPGWAFMVSAKQGADDTEAPGRGTSWYNPRVPLPWWHGRPGHGPGRGHKKPS